jgi:hypothetical protein
LRITVKGQKIRFVVIEKKYSLVLESICNNKPK